MSPGVRRSQDSQKVVLKFTSQKKFLLMFNPRWSRHPSVGGGPKEDRKGNGTVERTRQRTTSPPITGLPSLPHTFIGSLSLTGLTSGVSPLTPNRNPGDDDDPEPLLRTPVGTSAPRLPDTPSPTV